MNRSGAPAGADPEGMQAVAAAQLEERGVSYTIAPPVVARDLAEFAALSGLRMRQVVKTLLLEHSRRRIPDRAHVACPGPRTTATSRCDSGYALLVVAGDHSADFAALRRHLGARSVRLAAPEVVPEVAGHRIGRVTPFNSPTRDLPILIDATLLAEDVVSVGVGAPGRHVRLRGVDLPAALDGLAGPFAR